ncbi:MAG: DEAD/DEAH box helicase [Eubacterium sp.]|nr:DEAD/DEAH box helicase [Eubacterium sp.]
MAEENFTEVSFDELEIKDSLKRAVTEMGFENMTPIQEQAIPALLTGRDIIGQAQTGTGKTAAFGIPILERIDPEDKSLQAIILCPTRELAVQAAGEIRSFAQYTEGIRLLPVYGGQDIMRQIQGLRGAQIVVGTPGRVMDHMRRHTIKMDNVSMVVLDEADEMLDMGFREDMEVILGAIEREHQTCLFSATMPQAILDLADRFLNDPEVIKVTRKELTTANVKQYYYPVKREYKNIALVRLLDFYRYKRSVIFCNTKSMVDGLAELLQKAGYGAEGLHGDLTQKQRDSVMGRFRSGRLEILIATDIAARGIDVDDVEAVFNYDVPQENEYYVHRIGRTGRAGREGTAHTLCRNRDFRKIHEIEAVCHSKMEERKIPSVEEIRVIREQTAMDRVLTAIGEGGCEELIPTVEKCCEENGISVEIFAAALLRSQMGEAKRDGDDINVDMPARSERRRDRDSADRGERGNRGDSKDRGARSGHRRDRDERSGCKGDRGEWLDSEDWIALKKERGEWLDDDAWKAKKKERGEWEKRKDRDRDGRKHHDRKKDSHKGDRKGRGYEDDKAVIKEIKKKNKERSRKVLEAAVKDIRLNGDPKYKKKKGRKNRAR